ncbi:MAG TPA: acyl carrier protein [Pyrinomonadaceae bacterium]|nr:acyl carrier protein [Pyrinomonadaceae bacterium]
MDWKEIAYMDGKVENILAEVLQISITMVSDGLSMKDINTWDSLKHMELIVTLEQNFGIEFTFDDIVAMQSVREIKRVLRERSNVS